MVISISHMHFELIENYRDAFNEEQYVEKYSEVLNKYDYIVGDIGYEKLRLTGFYRDNKAKVERDKKFSAIQDYINEYCNFGCAYFVLRKLPKDEVKLLKESGEIKEPVDDEMIDVEHGDEALFGEEVEVHGDADVRDGVGVRGDVELGDGVRVGSDVELGDGVRSGDNVNNKNSSDFDNTGKRRERNRPSNSRGGGSGKYPKKNGRSNRTNINQNKQPKQQKQARTLSSFQQD